MNAILIALVLLALPSFAQAQATVITPASSLTFQSSPDHAVTDPVSGQALVTSYQADAIVSTGPTGALGWTQGLGKPTPMPRGTIAVAGAGWTPLYNAIATRCGLHAEGVGCRAGRRGGERGQQPFWAGESPSTGGTGAHRFSTNCIPAMAVARPDLLAVS
jgi:hypothetical protein